MKLITELREMRHGQSEYFCWDEEGGSEVYRIYNSYVLFEIPIYGGRPQYSGTFSDKEIDKLVDLIHSFT